ncbi:hypothetical protein QBC40DRAFT_350041 [Triangularia verruculosa]|uniref:VWFA domain-containing protein n=1 Tax=Triangularia verruculosa TaxID=2587418 RepID=A0AAN7AU45_9PEZI|nr:hypothetical protein QBC40DRAFT_350041 [Triangularia verruculosa]
MARITLVALLSTLPTLSLSFGTSTGTYDNNREHERITRAALACRNDVVSGNCFSDDSIDQLAGGIGKFGAVGNPDDPSAWGTSLEGHEAHCDGADFFNTPGYPQSRASASAVLLECVTHIKERLSQGITAAGQILDSEGYIKPDEAKIPLAGCIYFRSNQASNAKCSAILGFGRALHGIQDFYSHSNWADVANDSQPVSVVNPPGLGNSSPAPFFDTRFSGPPNFPRDLTTGCWEHDDETPGVGGCVNRITHNSLNKDGGDIDPDSGVATNPTPEKGPRGAVNNNFARAVGLALVDTQRQWRHFRNRLVEIHGEEKGARIVCALTRDDPEKECNGRKVAIVVDSSGSNDWTDPNNLRIAAARAINEELISQAEATDSNAKPDLVTVVDFDEQARIVYPLGDPANAHFSGIDSSGGTNIAAGIRLAIDEITGDDRYDTRGRSGIIVLTDGDDPYYGDRLAQLARAYLLGIKVSFGFLWPVAIPVTNPKVKRDGTLARRQAQTSEMLAAVLKTGGSYATIDSPEAQQAFVELLKSSGFSSADDGSSVTHLRKGLRIAGLINTVIPAAYYNYNANAGEDITIDVQSLSCTIDAVLLNVATGTVVGNNTSISSASGQLKYTAPLNQLLELAILNSDSATECVFEVQLAGVYVPLPTSVSTSTTVQSTSSTPTSTEISSSTTVISTSSTMNPSVTSTLSSTDGPVIVTSIVTSFTTYCPTTITYTTNGTTTCVSTVVPTVTTVTTLVTFTSCPGKCPLAGGSTIAPSNTGLSVVSVSTPTITSDATSNSPATASPPPAGGVQTIPAGEDRDETSATQPSSHATTEAEKPGQSGGGGGQPELTTLPATVDPEVTSTGISTFGVPRPSVQTATGMRRDHNLMIVGLVLVAGLALL